MERLPHLVNPRSAVIPIGIHRGFVAPDIGVAVLGEQEIAGRRRAHRKAGRVRSDIRQQYQDICFDRISHCR